MRAKPKPTRNTFTPELLVKQLAKDVPGFKSETPQVQAALASLVWIGATKLRQHTVHDGYMSFHHTELAAQFGGQFKAINARLGFLDVKDTWRFGKEAKATDTFTKGYRFSPVVQASREAFLAKRVTRLSKLSRLLDATGTGFRTPPKAVASTDMADTPTTRWRAANNDDSLSLVPVDIEALKHLQRDLAKKIDTMRRTGHAPRDLWMEYPSLDYLLDLRDKTAQIIRMAHTDVAGLGCVLHRYMESDSGRLYALGGASLQNAPAVIRQAALSGRWDYDVENCHFAIAAQMAKKAGFQCVAIEHYMAHKKAVRAEIADAIGITINQTKTCLLAVMYGARTTTWHENAIPQAIGDKAAALFALPTFANIADDVKLARAAILKQHKLNRQGGLVNAFGKSIKANAHSPEQRLAHLIQGVEAQALRACIELHRGKIILVQHDGFTAASRLDMAALELAIQTATGYALTLEEKPIRPDLVEQFGKAAQHEFSKVRRSRKASTGASFGHFYPTNPTVNSAGLS
jgi:hypothetical protein